VSDVIIRAARLGKRYRIGQLRNSHPTLREAIAGAATSVARATRTLAGRDGQSTRGATELWALRGVSFEVAQGEIVGIIGRNGAGKSTLLKLLARITRPTEGRAELRGRVGSLLEVGTGFHLELTGRENIYLNGAILGMHRAEIHRKFDEIVSFAEVERFLETPVKHYSSGMYLRLAFAVAAHLEPEILLVDEVLAVGDAAFQRKCLGKMSEVATAGRTVLFVSHNMDAVRRLCPRSLLIDGGALALDALSAEAIDRYLGRERNETGPNRCIALDGAARGGSGAVRFVAARYRSGNAATGDHGYTGGPLEFLLTLASDAPRRLESLAVTLYTRAGTKLVNADTLRCGEAVALAAGRNQVALRIVQLHLNPGVYVVGLWAAGLGVPYDHIEHAFEIEVVDVGPAQRGMAPGADGVVPCEFEIARAEEMPDA
jgi:ABC-type polysaccharide/polyol phosphate transport system ATPase subunit